LFRPDVCAKSESGFLVNELSLHEGQDVTSMKEKISREEVRHVATLARLELTEEEEKRMTEQMNDILTYMDKLNELDTLDIPPTTHATQLENVFRADEVTESLDRELALANAPQSDGVHFLVPKII
jgi:aspartyl-tRNA(Asn)/glutamyl-tRNA(Gln) amidotransferase subunit C